MKVYKWKQLSQWDAPKPEYQTKTKRVSTGLSSEACEWLLVECVDQGGGFIKTIPILKTDVTPEMLVAAG